MLDGAQRILIVGSSGSGKSTLARRLGDVLGLPVVYLDRHHWRPGWMEPPKEEWESIVDELIAAPRWIMDGNYSGTMERRIAASEAVLFLDLPRRVCIWRVLKRWALHWNERRPDMAEGCRERWDWKFLLWVWNYPNRSRPRVRQLIEERPESVRALILRSQTEIDILLKSQQENPSPKSMRQTVGGKQ